MCFDPSTLSLKRPIAKNRGGLCRRICSHDGRIDVTYDAVVATDIEGSGSPGRSVWRVLIGRPLRSSEMDKEQITPVEGLSALSLDALTSVAYGPEAIIVVLALAGAGSLHLVLPITGPSSRCWRSWSSRIARSSMPIRGVAARTPCRAPTSARVQSRRWRRAHRGLHAHRLGLHRRGRRCADVGLSQSDVRDGPICLAILAVITVLNLRGLGASARAFLLPQCCSSSACWRSLPLVSSTRWAQRVVARQIVAANPWFAGRLGATDLKAFSAGCSALTGVEAIANGVPLFREPRVKRAKRTEMMLGLILGAMLLGLAVLAGAGTSDRVRIRRS